MAVIYYSIIFCELIFCRFKRTTKQIEIDADILFVSTMFHDLGLTAHYRSNDKQFEVDSANAARDFLHGHGFYALEYDGFHMIE